MPCNASALHGKVVIPQLVNKKKLMMRLISQHLIVIKKNYPKLKEFNIYVKIGMVFIDGDQAGEIIAWILKKKKL